MEKPETWQKGKKKREKPGILTKTTKKPESSYNFYILSSKISI